MLMTLRLVAILTALLILVQAALAGQFLTVDPDYLDVHEIVGNALFMLVLVQAGLAIVERRSIGLWAAAANVSLVPLLVAQIGLGYLGRESTSAASIHIPFGVLTFGVAVVAAQLVLVSVRESVPQTD